MYVNMTWWLDILNYSDKKGSSLLLLFLVLYFFSSFLINLLFHLLLPITLYVCFSNLCKLRDVSTSFLFLSFW